MQDFLAPELRAVEVRFDALDRRIDGLTKIMDTRFDAIDTKFVSMSKEVSKVKDLLDIERRLAKLESREISISQEAPDRSRRSS